MNENDNYQTEFQSVIEAAFRASADVGKEVERILQQGREHPLTAEEAAALLRKVIEVVKSRAAERGDEKTLHALNGNVEELVQRILVDGGRRNSVGDGSNGTTKLELLSRNGINVQPVQPRPCFHGRDVPMMSGFVKTSDIKLWEKNERLDIHLNQFQHKFGRKPNPDELLDIMLSKLELPGVTETDQFEIVDLARSIAVNGVQRPPILDVDGTPLDGNRRITACHYILNSDEFDAVQKQRVEYIFVWQLTEHTTPDECDAVVIALNFEDDCKQKWPEYVKARKVYDEWQAILAVQPTTPGPKKQAKLKRELSVKFALGPDTTVVNRYLRMVDWAIDFEDHQINTRGQDVYTVKHRADKEFQYFDELSKGARPGTVAYSLGQDEAFKHLAFDLLFEDKFKNWKQIRALRYIYDNEEARDLLKKALAEQDVEEAEEIVDQACSVAHLQKAEIRSVGANTRIEVFVKWLEELPISAFRDVISKQNLHRLVSALKLAEQQASAILAEEPVGTETNAN